MRSGEEAAKGADAVTTVTNPVGVAVTIATGSLKAGSLASDATSAVKLAAKPSEAAKNPADAALTVKNVVQDIKEGAQAARSFVNAPPSADTEVSISSCVRTQ